MKNDKPRNPLDDLNFIGLNSEEEKKKSRKKEIKKNIKEEFLKSSILENKKSRKEEMFIKVNISITERYHKMIKKLAIEKDLHHYEILHEILNKYFK